MKKNTLKNIKLPAKPGVYFFQKGKTILYIGKATSLRDRVKSYFANDLIETRGPLIVDMVFKASTIKWQETDSVLEALILEASLIKKHQPYYNTREKDDKSWNYVCITKEQIPQVIVIRGKNIDLKNSRSNEYDLQAIFGPFTNGGQLREAMKIIRRIFPFVDTSSSKRDNYEFYRQLGLAPDFSNEEATAIYKNNLKHIKLFFEGKKKQILTSLEKEMKSLAKAKRFEEAGRVRNQLFALGHINDVALLKNEQQFSKITEDSYRIEAYDIAHMSGKNMVGVMTVVVDGQPDKNEYRKFIIRTQSGANDTGALEEILSRRFRHTEWGMPNLVVIDGGVAQINVAEKVLQRYQLPIPVVSVVKDDRHKAREVLGDAKLAKAHQKSIILANNEAHRFAITFHKQKRSENFITKNK